MMTDLIVNLEKIIHYTHLLHCCHYCWHFGSALAYDAPCIFLVTGRLDAGVCAQAQRAWLHLGAEAALLRHQDGLEGPRTHTWALRGAPQQQGRLLSSALPS